LAAGHSRALLVCFLSLLAGCGGTIGSFENAGKNSTDQALYERAMAFIRDENFQVATTLLETLVASYPESQYIGPANAALDDIWYAEGGVGPRPEPVNGVTVKFFPPIQEAQN
jgi:outer membrane protein assembly factor BamD (BamD/ComL family)